jgi:hypothetical protein
MRLDGAFTNKSSQIHPEPISYMENSKTVFTPPPRIIFSIYWTGKSANRRMSPYPLRCSRYGKSVSDSRESGFKFRESDFDSRESRFEFRESDFKFRESRFEFRESNFEFRESGFEFRESGFDSRESRFDSREYFFRRSRNE